MSTPPTVSALPEVPATSDPQFEIKAPALFNAIKNTFVGEVNAVASWINAGSWLTNPLAVGSGGTGVSTITGYVKGNGTSAFTASATIPVGDISGTLPVGSGGTGLTTIPAGRIMYGNGASAVSTSSSLTYDGTTFSALGSPSGNTFRVGATSSGDCVLLSGLAAGSGATIAGMNSAMSDYEPLRITSEALAINIRNGTGTSFELGNFNSNISTWTAGAAGLELFARDNHALIRLCAPNTNSFFLTASNPANYIYGTAYVPIIFGTNNTERMRLSPAGDLGISATPSAWTSFRALQIYNAAIAATATQFNVSQNSYYNGAYRYIATNFATLYNQISGGHYWYVAPSGTAGDAITFSKVMEVTSTGLGIGLTSSPSAKIHAISTTEQLRLGYDVSNYTSLSTDSGGNFIISPTGGGIRINQAPAGSAGAATGKYLTLNLNGTVYKIALLANA